MEQNIGILFVVIGSLSASIGILEKNYMFGIDRSVDKFNKKYNVNIDNATYCRFEGKLESARSFLDILDDDTIATKLNIDVDIIKKLRIEKLKK